jgi:gamma-glutamyltranspeptidase / glutathione hydrolase
MCVDYPGDTRFAVFSATFVLAFLVCGSASVTNAWEPSPETVIAAHGLVVTDSTPASEVGVAVLRQGGNAVDAAVATALALAVAFPEAGNLGGGGFMLVHPGNDAEAVCIDYRETAPAAATATMFSLGERRLGHKVVGVPGTLRGLELAHQRFGNLPWHMLVKPAMRLAQEGFELDVRLAEALNELLASSGEFAELKRVFGKEAGAAPWRAGDRFIQPELASTLRLIAEHGATAYYEGGIAKQIVAEMELGGGLITRADLAGYKVKVRKPLRGTYRGYQVLGAPPPSSGGTATIEALNILEQFDLRSHDRWSPRTGHLLIEALRRAYCDRARWLGDPDFVEVPPELIAKDYARRLADQIDLDGATPSERLAPEIVLTAEGAETTHFSVIDAKGMAVANTYTLEESYGSRVVVRGAGFLLNNEMGDFNWRPGQTDRRGQIGTPANTIAPGKRMLSSQSPTIVLRDGRVVLVTGSPGGRTIISTVTGLLINVLEYDMKLQQAVAAPRLHHGWLPDRVLFEGAGDSAHAALVEQLRGLGHVVDGGPHKQGSANSIWVDRTTGERHGVADPRRAGRAVGY